MPKQHSGQQVYQCGKRILQEPILFFAKTKYDLPSGYVIQSPFGAKMRSYPNFRQQLTRDGTTQTSTGITYAAPVSIFTFHYGTTQIRGMQGQVSCP